MPRIVRIVRIVRIIGNYSVIFRYNYFIAVFFLSILTILTILYNFYYSYFICLLPCNSHDPHNSHDSLCDGGLLLRTLKSLFARLGTEYFKRITVKRFGSQLPAGYPFPLALVSLVDSRVFALSGNDVRMPRTRCNNPWRELEASPRESYSTVLSYGTYYCAHTSREEKTPCKLSSSRIYFIFPVSSARSAQGTPVPSHQ
jgi:hypothetical protein